MAEQAWIKESWPWLGHLIGVGCTFVYLVVGVLLAAWWHRRLNLEDDARFAAVVFWPLGLAAWAFVTLFKAVDGAVVWLSGGEGD